MSGFTLQSGKRTEEVSFVCPICADRRSVGTPAEARELRSYVPLRDLACSEAHRMAYLSRVWTAVRAIGQEWLLEDSWSVRQLAQGLLGVIPGLPIYGDRGWCE